MNLKSYCKVNLYLEVVNKRKDGYHNIDTLFQTINLYDTISISELNNGEINFSCNLEELNTQNNLIWKAVKKLEPYIPKVRKGVQIQLDKKLPMGAGLGGGSSNCAVTLVGLNDFYNLNLSNEKLIELGAQLGADVPFFIQGGIARGEGIGEKLTYFSDLSCPMPMIIIYPKIHISTQSAYGNLTFNKPKAVKVENMINALKNKSIQEVANNLYNQFEESQFNIHPVLQEIKNNLIKNGAVGALMSGSGSSIFGIFNSKEQAEKAYTNLDYPDYEVYLTETN